MPVTAPGIVYRRLWDTALRRGRRRDFIPPLSEGNKCRGTFDQPTPHAAPASTRPATPTRKFAFPSPKMIAELYYRITLWKGPPEVKLEGRYATPLFI